MAELGGSDMYNHIMRERFTNIRQNSGTADPGAVSTSQINHKNLIPFQFQGAVFP
jgi:hypothetical protein